MQKQVYALAAGAKTVAELKPAFTALINGLRDHHAKILDAETYGVLAAFTDYKNVRSKDSRPRDTKIWTAVNDTSLKFEHRILNGNTGYLKIVGIGPRVDVEAEAKKIRGVLTAMAEKKISNWILDLRYNGGGNMHPMMAGIAPLLGNGLAGKLADLEKKTLFTWEIEKGNFIYAGYQALKLPNKPVFRKIQKVAVLTSRWTVSSGEVVAASFKGRPNSRFFGEATGGYTTNNGWEIIAGSVILNISTGFFADRNGNIFSENIPVDEEVLFKLEKNIQKDECVIKALKWLQKK